MTAALAEDKLIAGPGVYGMPEGVYHADPVPGGSLSVSGAKKLLPPSCPAAFRYEQDHPKPPSDAMDLGTVAHKMVLGSGPEIVVVDAANWMTKAAKEQREAARQASKVALLAGDYARAQAMANAVRSHPIAGALLHPDAGTPEQSLFWQDRATGIMLRARADFLPSAGSYGGRFIITDLKTCASAEPGAAIRSVMNFRYFMQAPWYADGAAALGLHPDPSFLFVFVESAPPHLITVIQLDDEAMQAGRNLNRQAIERYRDCTEAGVWPGYSDDIELVSLPPWAYRQMEIL
jgi:PDDEXK-like domain of unknown function (DUF3799)